MHFFQQSSVKLFECVATGKLLLHLATSRAILLEYLSIFCVPQQNLWNGNRLKLRFRIINECYVLDPILRQLFETIDTNNDNLLKYI